MPEATEVGGGEAPEWKILGELEFGGYSAVFSTMGESLRLNGEEVEGVDPRLFEPFETMIQNPGEPMLISALGEYIVDPDDNPSEARRRIFYLMGKLKEGVNNRIPQLIIGTSYTRDNSFEINTQARFLGEVTTVEAEAKQSTTSTETTDELIEEAFLRTDVGEFVATFDQAGLKIGPPEQPEAKRRQVQLTNQQRQIAQLLFERALASFTPVRSGIIERMNQADQAISTRQMRRLEKELASTIELIEGDTPGMFRFRERGGEQEICVGFNNGGHVIPEGVMYSADRQARPQNIKAYKLI